MIGDHSGTGNRCGHNPNNWRRFVPPEPEPGHKPHPLFCLRAAQAWWQLIHDNPKLIPQQRGETRAQRSERGEAVALLGAAMHYDTDILSQRIGKEHDDGSFSGNTLASYSAQLSLGLERVNRAVRTIARVAFIKTHEVCEEVAEGVIRGLAAIRVWPKEIYTMIGKDRWLAFEQKRQANKAKTNGRRARQALARIRLARKAADKPKTLREEALEREQAARAETRRRLTERLGTENLQEIEAERDRARAERRALLDLPDQPLYGENPEAPDTS